MSTFELRGIKKNYGDQSVLQGVDLVLDPSETVVLTGPNGCGKSTLLRIIAGLENADGGEVLLDGRSLLQAKPHQRPIGFVSQLGGYYEHLTVRQNLQSSLQPMRFGPKDLASRIDWLSDLLGLDSILESSVQSLSGGQIQKVALGRGLARKPRILLMDEPLNHLDRATQQRLHLELAKIKSELELSILYVTHDSDEALSIADRLAVLQEGVIQQIDRPQVVYDRPRTPAIANLFGNRPFLFAKGTMDRHVQPTSIRVWNRDLILNERQLQEIASRLTDEHPIQTLEVGARPESFTLCNRRDAACQENPYVARWTTTVIERRFAGDRWLFRCTLDDNQSIVLRLDRNQLDDIQDGSTFELCLDASKLCFF